MKKTIVMLAAMLCASAAFAQEPQLPLKVENVELEDLYGEKVSLPMWGEKNLLIFYIDPDKHKQNYQFTVDLEENHAASGDNIYGFGIVNLKDSWYPVPDSTIRSMARKRTEKNGATVITDPDRILAEKWGLGDCNNKFVLMIVSKEGELVYMKKGELSEADQAEFYEVIKKYR